MISKELLSGVLKVDLGWIKNYPPKFEGNLIILDDRNLTIETVSHKCKEFALIKGYKLLSAITFNGEGMCTTLHKLRGNRKTFIAKTEYDAVIKATQFVYDNTRVSNE